MEPVGLAEYIENNIEHLAAEWEEFVRRNLPEAGSTEAADRARILRAIVAEMCSLQSRADRRAKSNGDLPGHAPTITEKARGHAIQRLRDGFTLDQLVSEYGALRASVVQGWTVEMTTADRAHLDELVRFDEALDQSLTEAIRWFNNGLNKARDLFVGILGHDLRDPLSAVKTATGLQRLAVDNLQAQRANEAADRNLDRMADMIDDLLDFARTRLGGQLQLELREQVDMQEICEEITESLKLSYQDNEIVLDCRGELEGTWDVDRIRQVIANLGKNALDYGDSDSPVGIVVDGQGDEIILSVRNQGPPIPEEHQQSIFDPLSRGAFGGPDKQRSGDSLGLGLYIVNQIVEAHGGSIRLTSDEDAGTTFEVRLPRGPKAISEQSL